MVESSHAARLAEGVALFNRGLFFEAHDVWEDLWAGTRGPERDFLRGLIHCAVGCYHLNAANLEGARSQLARCREALDTYAPVHGGLDVAALLVLVENYLERAAAEDPSGLAGIAGPRILQSPLRRDKSGRESQGSRGSERWPAE
jgi:predicted metal-dependent hydrolase